LQTEETASVAKVIRVTAKGLGQPENLDLIVTRRQLDIDRVDVAALLTRDRPDIVA
jgi:hypothetical protein